jgi:hypothetical protein
LIEPKNQNQPEKKKKKTNKMSAIFSFFGKRDTPKTRDGGTKGGKGVKVHTHPKTKIQ